MTAFMKTVSIFCTKTAICTLISQSTQKGHKITPNNEKNTDWRARKGRSGSGVKN